MSFRTATPSVLALNAWRDHTVHVTFRTVDAVGLTEVTLDPEPVTTEVLLQLVDAAIIRLVAWRRDFVEAEKEDSLPIPYHLPVYGRER